MNPGADEMLEELFRLNATVRYSDGTQPKMPGTPERCVTVEWLHGGASAAVCMAWSEARRAGIDAREFVVRQALHAVQAQLGIRELAVQADGSVVAKGG